jgi:hypothetical protein
MLQITCTQGNWGDSRLLVIGSQIANLIPDVFSSHNLCVNVWKDFQWYKELFNPMSFDPYNCSFKIRESTGIPTPKVGAHLGMWKFIPSHSLALLGAWNMTLGLPSWPAPLQALALVVSPRLGLWQPFIWRVVVLNLIVALGLHRLSHSLLSSSSWPRIAPVPKALQWVCRMKTLLNQIFLEWGTLKVFPWVC